MNNIDVINKVDFLHNFKNFHDIKQKSSSAIFILKSEFSHLDSKSKSNLLASKRNIVQKLMLSNNRVSNNLKKEILRGADLREVDLSGIKFTESDLSDARFDNANLREASFDNSQLNNTLFCNADLSDACFSNTDLSNSSFINATLTNTSIIKCPLTNVNFQNAVIEKINIDFKYIELFHISNNEKYNFLCESIKQKLGFITRLKFEDLDGMYIKTYYKDTNEIYAKEPEAINLFRSSLDSENPLQKRIESLDNNQLMIYLPLIFVEHAHRLDPLLAYHTYEINDFYLHDDNINMITAYANFLKSLNEGFLNNYSITQENKCNKLSIMIKKLVEVILVSPSKFNFKNGLFFNLKLDKIYKQDEFLKKISTDNTLKLSSMNASVIIEPNYDFGEKIKCMRGINDRSESNIERVFSEFLTKLIDAHNQKDLKKIFELTSDFQYLHLFSNGNGRISQVIRDCFAIYMGMHPFSNLHSMSPYSFLGMPAEQKLLDFMQKNSEEILIAVEKRELTPDNYLRESPEARDRLLAAGKTHPAVQLDIQTFLEEREIQKNAA